MLPVYKKILFSMAPVYETYKREIGVNGMDEYATLLIDKFALESSTLYHIASGFIESVHSTRDRVLMGFDIFSFNSIFRQILETYVAFHSLFIFPKDEDEKRLRFLLWKLDGLNSKSELEFSDEAWGRMLREDQIAIELAEKEIEQNLIVKTFLNSEVKKIYKKDKTYKWRFRIEGNEIREFSKIIFAKIICKSKQISNSYNLSSMHVHSGIHAVEQFKRVRGRLMDDDYVNQYILLATYLTCCVMKDMSSLNDSVFAKYDNLETETKQIIDLIYEKVRDARDE